MSYNLNNNLLKDFWSSIFRFLGYLIGVIFLVIIIGYSFIGVRYFIKYLIEVTQ